MAFIYIPGSTVGRYATVSMDEKEAFDRHGIVPAWLTLDDKERLAQWWSEVRQPQPGSPAALALRAQGRAAGRPDVELVVQYSHACEKLRNSGDDLII